MTHQSIYALTSFLETNKELSFSSPIQKLSRWKIFLFSLAGNDFNPIHCKEGYAEYSTFKSIVSQGIGTIARAEGFFVNMMKFVEPTEIIALGIDNLRYYAPLKIGARHQYHYTLQLSEKKGNHQNYTCSITCKTVDGIIIASWSWTILFIPIKDKSVKKFYIQSRVRNIFEYLIFRPVNSLVLSLVFMSISYSFIVLILNICGIIHTEVPDYYGEAVIAL